MRTTRLSDFQDELRRTGSYRTHDDCRAPERAKPSFLTTLRYSWGMTRVFPYCAFAQPLGKLTTDYWAELCFSSVTVPDVCSSSFRLAARKIRRFLHVRQ